jgi:hypothetical protein
MLSVAGAYADIPSTPESIMTTPICYWFKPLIRFLELRSAARRSLALADGGRRSGVRCDQAGSPCRDADAAIAAAAARRPEEGCCHV